VLLVGTHDVVARDNKSEEGSPKNETGPKDYGLLTREPYAYEIESNAVIYSEGIGYRCVRRLDSPSETETAMFVEEKPPNGAECSPAVWRDWELNCDGTWDEDILCNGDQLRADLSTMLFTGNESCALLVASLSARAGDDLALTDMEAECKDSHTIDSDTATSGGHRRLDYFTFVHTGLTLFARVMGLPKL
jgi:hypothetical protein